jgi:aspartate-semialdehyde dehydrogenase
VEWQGESLTVQHADDFDPAGFDAALFSAGSSVSLSLAPRIAAGGCTVVDNSSAYRMDADKILAVPEVNGSLLDGLRPGSIVANPNCSTIQLVVALKPLADAVGLDRVNVCTYQAVSGAGRKGIEALENDAYVHSPFAVPIRANVVPQIDVFESDGFTKEEHKVINESRRILGLPDLRVNVTAVRVPVVNGHAIAAHIETRTPISIDVVRELLSCAPGICLVEGDGKYPTPRFDADGTDAVYVGRIRKDPSHPNGINMWIVADNLRKGAALNAIQILERIGTKS